MPLLSSHLNIWPNPWYIFGIQAIFAEIWHLSRFPSLWLHFSFATRLMESCSIPHLSFSWKLPTVNMFLLLPHYFFFGRPSMNPCQTGQFRNLSFSYDSQLSTCLFFHIGFIFAKPFVNSCQMCHFVKPTISCQDAPFWHLPEYLAKPFKNTWLTRHFCLNFPFSHNCHLARFPSLWPHLSFCQTFEGFLPNFPFSQIGHFRKISNGQYASFFVLFARIHANARADRAR